MKLFAAGPVTVRKTGTAIQLGNDFLERTIEVDAGMVRTTKFWNKLSGRTFEVEGDEFELKLTLDFRGQSNNEPVYTTHDFHLVSTDVSDTDAGGKRISFRLAANYGAAQRILELDAGVVSPWKAGQDPAGDADSLLGPDVGVEVTLVYELKPNDFYSRKWISLRKTIVGTPFVSAVAVEKNNWHYPASFFLGGFGRPLLADDLFAGLEYPSSLDSHAVFLPNKICRQSQCRRGFFGCVR